MVEPVAERLQEMLAELGVQVVLVVVVSVVLAARVVLVVQRLQAVLAVKEVLVVLVLLVVLDVPANQEVLVLVWPVLRVRTVLMPLRVHRY